VLTLYVNSQLEQVKYLRTRIDKLEVMVDECATANMVQKQVITNLTDSLSKGADQ